MSTTVNPRLRAGELTLELSPSIGGAIAAFEWSREGSVRPILRKCHSPLGNVLDAACFPLVPYVNRIRGGQFSFRGKEVRLAPNMAGDPSPLHGQGWLGSWSLDEANERTAVLRFRHQSGEWPWDYEARQHFELDEGGLLVRLECVNLAEEPMPCGLGLHPYFPCTAETLIDTSVEAVWTIDEHVLPVEKVPADGRYSLRERLICGQNLDNGFGGWSGEAHISDPNWPYALRLSSPDARFFQIYSPRDGSIFVAEPVTHANTALNAPESDWPKLGLRVLEPGQSMGLSMRLDVQPG